MSSITVFKKHKVLECLECSYCGSDTALGLISASIGEIGSKKSKRKKLIICSECYDRETAIEGITIKDVRFSVKAQFEGEVMPDNFDDFWSEVDVMNAYEEFWEITKDKLKPLYLEVFNKIKG